jgi:hypothetical protein
VDFSLNAAFVQQYFEAHRGETLRASYQIWRAESDGTSYSNPLAFVVGGAPALSVDTSPLSLSGNNISIAGSGLNWIFTGHDPVGTSAHRPATGGHPPYTYTAIDPLIASTNSATGTIRSEGNGTTEVIVTDDAGQSLSIKVTTANVTRILYNPTPLDRSGADAWIRSVGGFKLDGSIAQYRWVRDLMLLKFTPPETVTYGGGSGIHEVTYGLFISGVPFAHPDNIWNFFAQDTNSPRHILCQLNGGTFEG